VCHRDESADSRYSLSIRITRWGKKDFARSSSVSGFWACILGLTRVRLLYGGGADVLRSLQAGTIKRRRFRLRGSCFVCCLSLICGIGRKHEKLKGASKSALRRFGSSVRCVRSACMSSFISASFRLTSRPCGFPCCQDRPTCLASHEAAGTCRKIAIHLVENLRQPGSASSCVTSGRDV